MPFEKGNKFSKGRPKGARDKFRPDVAKMFQDWDFNPLAELRKIVLESNSEKHRLQAAAELAQYYAPKLKAVDITIDDETKQAHENFLESLKNVGKK